MSNACERKGFFFAKGQGFGSSKEIAKHDAVSQAMDNGRRNCVFGKCGAIGQKCGFTGLPGQAVVLNPDDDPDGTGVFEINVAIKGNCICAES